ncbi:MAG: flagellar motor switch protein FliN [Labilithrix sp.]|nr:flagellar motor switch protein FliN [Labilithrix sp.]
MTNGRIGTPPATALGLLRDVEVEVTLEIGRKRMKIGDLLRLGTGQTLELDKAAGEPLEIVVNGRLIGRGEAVVLGDRYGLRITEIVTSPAEHDGAKVSPEPAASVPSAPAEPQ